MSKRKQKRTKRNNIDTSLDTSSKPKLNLFPHVLRGKKLLEPINTELHASLENYLKTEDPKDLFKAIKQDAFCLQGRGLTQDDLRYHSDSTEIDVHTVVWVTIEYWQDICLFKLGTKKVIDKAKSLLGNIGNALIPENKAYYERPCTDYFVHIKPQWKGSHPSIEYRNAYDFVQRFQRVRKAFEETKSKKRYNSNTDAHLKEEDAVKAIKKLENVLYDDDVELLDLSNIRTKTASYICLVNEISCPICKKEGLQYKTILRLFDKAKKELKL